MASLEELIRTGIVETDGLLEYKVLEAMKYGVHWMSMAVSDACWLQISGELKYNDQLGSARSMQVRQALRECRAG
jgi:hypothetical protein